MINALVRGIDVVDMSSVESMLDVLVSVIDVLDVYVSGIDVIVSRCT